MGIGSNIKKILAEKKMKITELSEKSGVKINTLYSITKRDSVNVNAEVLAAIAKALDVSTFDLTIDTEQLRADVKTTESIIRLYGSDAIDLLNYFDELTPDGKKKACDYVYDLTQIPEYSKNKKAPVSAATPTGSGLNLKTEDEN